MNKLLSVVVEALVVGVLVVVVGTLVSLPFRFIKTTSDACKGWNKYYVMEASLFLTGFFTHLLCEVVGLNKWYCQNGTACR